MELTVSPNLLMAGLLALMLFITAVATYLRGWQVFWGKKYDPFERVAGGLILWGVSLGCVFLLYRLVTGELL